MDHETDFLHKNNIWELVRKLKNRRIVECKWIFKIKEGMSATKSKRFKFSLMAKGYTRKEGINFKEVFSIRVLLALTAVYDIELDKLNVKIAFLHRKLQEEILMTQLQGYMDSEKANYVYLLKMSLYGLK